MEKITDTEKMSETAFSDVSGASSKKYFKLRKKGIFKSTEVDNRFDHLTLYRLYFLNRKLNIILILLTVSIALSVIGYLR